MDLDLELKKAYLELFKRYNTIAQENKDTIRDNQAHTIMQMGINAIGSPERFPAEKMSRWLGFIQGILFANGVITIDEERNISRPLIHRAYKNAGLNPPESIDIKKELIDSWGEAP
jgi:hypothetical protein